MIKNLSISLLLVLLSLSGYSQSMISIAPNSGVRGTTISTTITGTGFSFTTGTAPSTWGNLYMKKSSTYLYPLNVTILNNNQVTADWSLPANYPTGNYQVSYEEWPLLYSVPGGFTLADNFVTGQVFNDLDSSGTLNGTEYGLANTKVLLLPDSLYSFTDSNGNYVLPATVGNKDVKVSPSPIWINTTTSPVNVNVTGTLVTGIDFGLKAFADVYDIDITLSPSSFARCFTNVNFYITYRNTGTVTNHGEVSFIRSSNCAWVSSSIPPDLINGNVYTWNYIDLLPLESRTIVVTLTMPGPGSVVTNSAQVIARDDLNNIVDVDEDLVQQNVVCSYDPNDKTVQPEGVFTQHYTLMSDTLDFLVRFQNTGNDTAFKVVIVDTMDISILDLNTFEIIDYSHPVNVDLRTNGKATFTFENILLPDSNVNEPGSHGFVRYRCMAKTGLPANTILNNTAYIYFDFNPAVITNTTLNTLVYVIPVGLTEPDGLNSVTVIPNPVTEDAILSFNNQQNENFTLLVYDARGKLISAQSINGTQATLSGDKLKSGLYFYQLRNLNGSRDMKGQFVVAK